MPLGLFLAVFSVFTAKNAYFWTLVWRQTPKIRGHDSYWWMPWFRHNQTSEFSIKNLSEFDVIKNV